ncbi:hypothetical protein KIPB_010738 [Kipferlia bialata]|uniref:Uncharacterized protein n=1 Tax=Kipferlia bialata TaxID=797122 RepID=A0A9K3GLS5_9EUKA|nr:hypothetical protein KIPB_010738 [Kipferlia bialata]|eukprot:g10738.t1
MADPFFEGTGAGADEMAAEMERQLAQHEELMRCHQEWQGAEGCMERGDLDMDEWENVPEEMDPDLWGR